MNNNDYKIYSGRLNLRLTGFRNAFADFITKKAVIDESSINKIREYSEKGHVVYCSYQSSNYALLFLYKLLKRNEINPPEFALEYNPFLLQKPGFIYKRFKRLLKKVFLRKKYKDAFESGYLENLIRNNKPVLFPLLSQKFFLKRYLEKKYDSLVFFIELQHKTEKPIFLFPHIIFWNRNPERSSKILKFSPTGNMGIIRGLLNSATPSYATIIDPVNLKEFISKYPPESSFVTALRLRDELLNLYHTEKRIVLGPVLRSKSEMMEMVLYHKNVLNCIDEISKDNPKKMRKSKQRAYRYYNEIAADFRIGYVKIFELICDWMFKKIFSGMEYDAASLESIRESSRKGPLVFVPCHRSHMDYIILSYVFYKNRITPPHVAAGANLSFFPIGKIFRHSGAFFLRRSFKGLDLYPVVFRQYMKTLVHESFPLEYFIEGGRTRTGRLVLPKFGITNYLIEAVDEGYSEDLFFVPISINYDRVLEENSYVKELKGKDKKKESVGGVLKSLKVLTRDYGKVYLNVGEIFSLKDIEEKTDVAKRSRAIGDKIIRRINRAVPINPVSLVTAAMLILSKKGFDKQTLEAATLRLYIFFETKKISFAADISDKSMLPKQISRIIKMYLKDFIIEEVKMDENQALEGVYILREESRAAIAFYKNTISHHCLDISMLSCSLIMCSRQTDMTKENLKNNFFSLFELLENEFVLEESLHDFDKIYSDYLLNYFQTDGVVRVEDDKIEIIDSMMPRITEYARFISDIFESYYIVFKLLKTIGRKTITKKDLVLEIRKFGMKQYITDQVSVPESLSAANYNSALKKAARMGAVEEEYKSKRYSVIHKRSVENLEHVLKVLSDIVNI
ncbi:MAG: 1-acyl-sn-glycerol-3-phosphate acyltransferase [Spirochaetes bacterium]|nr:1-acyl-sn-glycerol-3-phosphate acyltransferase [Spirochaetota bacterium]